jgi:hypothetical protein
MRGNTTFSFATASWVLSCVIILVLPSHFVTDPSRDSVLAWSGAHPRLNDVITANIAGLIFGICGAFSILRSRREGYLIGTKGLGWNHWAIGILIAYACLVTIVNRIYSGLFSAGILNVGRLTAEWSVIGCVDILIRSVVINFSGENADQKRA